MYLQKSSRTDTSMHSTRSIVFVITRIAYVALRPLKVGLPASLPPCLPASLPAKVMHEISSPELLMTLYELHDTREQNNDLIYDMIPSW